MSSTPLDEHTWDGVHQRLPHSLRAQLSITEVDDGAFFVESLFQRKFRDAAPSMQAGHHVVAFVRTAEGAFVPIAYTLFRMIDQICLVGGMSTDGRAFAHLDQPARDAVAAGGGLAYYMLHYGFARYPAAAFFGHVGDPRAREVDLRAGFRDTPHEHLMIYTPHPIPDHQRATLIAQAHAIGPF